MNTKNEFDHHSGLDRRGFLNRAGLALASTTMLGSGLLSLTGLAKASGFDAAGDAVVDLPVGPVSAMKPVNLPPLGNVDPVAHSLADSLFWGDIMMEHALFFTMLMPGAEIAAYNRQANQFRIQFAQHLALIKRLRIDRSNYKALNQRTISLIKPFHAFKLRMLELQLAGKIHTLVWPLFFAHTAREAERFITRLEMYSSGKVEFVRGEVVEFWTLTMGEHAQFIAHLLDPQEVQLIQKANATAETFLETLKRSPRNFQALLHAGEEIIDFKTAAERGIETGKIKSIIHPALADHVRREAIKYVDELKRT